MSTLKVDNIIDSEGGNTTSINGISLTAGALNQENRIINGAFDVWQRGTTFTSAGYSADRWSNSFSGGTVTTSRLSFENSGIILGTNCPSFYLRQSVSGQTSSAQYAAVVQLIEGARSYAGQTITVLGWARRASGSGNMAIEAVQNFGTGGSPSAQVYIPGQTIPLTDSFAPFAITMQIPSFTGKSLGSAGNDNLQFTFWTSAGSDYNVRSNSLGLQTISVDLWGIHVRVGTHTVAAADLYIQPDITTEQLRCFRYFWSTGSSRLEYRIYSLNANIFYAPFTLPVPMRAQPVFSLANDVSSGVNSTVAGGAAGGGTAAFIQATAISTGMVSINTSVRADAEF
jgi:hypothetical protein